MARRPLIQLRIPGVFIAAVAASYAAWVLAIEISRPRLPTFPTDKHAAATLAANQISAEYAAMIGFVRGDLWSEYAITLVANRNFESGRPPIIPNTAAIAVSERSIALGPHDARPWLLLADVHASLDGLNQTILGPLKMSYYTAPNEPSLIPLRLSLATRTEAVIDPDIQVLATNDIRTALMRRPDLKPALVSAYHGASPDGKRFLDTAINLLDPGFVAQLHGPAASQ